MGIPLNLDVVVRQTGAEVFGLLEKGIASVGQAAAAKTAAGLQSVEKSLQGVMAFAGPVSIELGFISSALLTLSQQAQVTPMQLDLLATRLDDFRVSLIKAKFPALDLEQALRKLTKEDWVLQDGVQRASDALRTQAVALQTVERSTVKVTQSTKRSTVATKKATTATKSMGREARLTALSGMNVLSSATQGVMMAMGLLQGSVMSVGFGLIFLRYSIAPITLGVAALVASIGGVVKAITFVGPAFEKLVAGPMTRVKAAVVEAIGYFSGAVWVRIIVPTIRILADLTEKFRDLALQMWLGTGVQKAWGELLGMIQGTFQNLNRTIKEHGGILKWVVRTGFIIAINVLKGLIYLINVAINVLPQLAYMWRRLSKDLKGVWATLGLVAGALKELGLDAIIQKVKEWALDADLSEMLVLALAVVKNKKGALITLLSNFLFEELLGLFTDFDADTTKLWTSTWNFVSAGAFIGFTIAGPKGAIVGVALGLLIGLFTNFKTEVVTASYEVRIAVERMSLALYEWAVRSKAVTGDALISVQNSIANMKQEIGEYEQWKGMGKPSLEFFLDQDTTVQKSFGEWLDAMEKARNRRQGTTLGKQDIVIPSIAGWRQEDMLTRPETRPYSIGAGIAGLAEKITVIITGNNIYGKLDDENVRIWAGQIGYALTRRTITRYGAGLP